MSKMEYLDPLEAEIFRKQKWEQFLGTPCRIPTLCLATFQNDDFMQGGGTKAFTPKMTGTGTFLGHKLRASNNKYRVYDNDFL